MCVAFIANQPIPLSDLQLMEDTNPDGGGVGWLDKKSGKFRYIKGITAKDMFDLQEANVMSFPYLGHFRWATHGPKVPELCHPFPVGVKALYDESTGEADEIMMHNGTWGGYEKWMPSWLPTQVQDNLSDTAVAAYVCAFFPEILQEVSWATARAGIGADGNAEITLTGSWKDYQGNRYSNLHWRPYQSSFTRDYYEGKYGPKEWWETWRGKEWQAWAAKKAPDYDAEPGLDGEDNPMGGRCGACDDDEEPSYWPDGYEKEKREYASFEEYVEAKYGPNVARLAMEIDPTGDELTNSELEAMALSNPDLIGPGGFSSHYDDDFISEDAAEVNEWLSRQVERKVY